MNLKKLYMETIKSKTGYLFTVEDAKEIEKIIDYYETKYNETVKKYNNCYCERTDCAGRIKDSKKYDSLEQKYNKQVDNWNKLKKDLELVVDYGLGDESSKWDKIYGEYAKSTLKFMQELEQGRNSNVKD
mgnify:CR=1 FL=1